MKKSKKIWKSLAYSDFFTYLCNRNNKQKQVMAQYFSFIYKGEKFEARCTSRDTRNGFAHDCDIHDSNYNDCATATCYYLNRTWECFRYESVLHAGIERLARDEEFDTIERWKRENGKSRISKVQREKLTAPIWAAYEAALKTIKAL